MSETIHETLSKLTKIYEEAELTAFKRCGYDKDWVVANRSRIFVEMERSKNYNDITFTYLLDGEPMFELRRMLNVDYDTGDYSGCIQCFIYKDKLKDGDTLETEY